MTKKRMRMKTWHCEAAFIAVVLAGTVLASGGSATEWIGALAVWISSRHMSVADRLQEREAVREQAEVSCYRWLNRYWVAKEAIWLQYFVLLEAWSALAGVVLFLLYPYWRRVYRRWRPVDRVQTPAS